MGANFQCNQRWDRRNLSDIHFCRFDGILAMFHLFLFTRKPSSVNRSTEFVNALLDAQTEHDAHVMKEIEPRHTSTPTSSPQPTRKTITSKPLALLGFPPPLLVPLASELISEVGYLSLIETWSHERLAGMLNPQAPRQQSLTFTFIFDADLTGTPTKTPSSCSSYLAAPPRKYMWGWISSHEILGDD